MKTTTHCLPKAMLSRCVVFLSSMLPLVISLQAQEQEKETLHTEAAIDLVSQNIWRGVYQSGASVQPSVSAVYKGLELFAWGSTDFRNTQREIDFTLHYVFHGFTVGITDYWNGSDSTNYSANHQWEGCLKYTFSRIPLSLEWNTVFGGEERAGGFSSYAAIDYLLELPALDFDFSIGFTPWKNSLLETERFTFINFSVVAGKELFLHPQLPTKVLCGLVYNPAANQLFFTVGIGFLFSNP